MCSSLKGDINPDIWRPWMSEDEDSSFTTSSAQKLAGDNDNPTEENLSSFKLLKCDLCSRKFKRESELRRHKNSKHFRKVERCRTCDKMFTRKDNLTRHLKIAHLDKGKPVCKYCNKLLSRRDALQRHESRCPKNLGMKPEDIIRCEEGIQDNFPNHIERLRKKYPKLESKIREDSKNTNQLYHRTFSSNR